MGGGRVGAEGAAAAEGAAPPCPRRRPAHAACHTPAQTMQHWWKAAAQTLPPLEAALRGQLDPAKGGRAATPLEMRVWRSAEVPPAPKHRAYAYRVATADPAGIAEAIRMDLCGNYKTRARLAEALAAAAPITERWVELRAAGWRGVVEVEANAGSPLCLHLEVRNDIMAEAALDGRIAGLEQDSRRVALLAGKPPPETMQ